MADTIAMPARLAPAISEEVARAVSDQALASTFDVSWAETVRPTRAWVRGLGFRGATPYLQSETTRERFRQGYLMYWTQYRVPGYRDETGHATTEIFDVYVDATTGDPLAVEPPFAVSAVAPAKKRGTFRWQDWRGSLLVESGRKSARVKAAAVTPMEKNLGKKCHVAVLRNGNATVRVWFDPQAGTLSFVSGDEVLAGKPNAPLLKALRSLPPSFTKPFGKVNSPNSPSG